jgi:hypothetical protein
VAIVAFIVHLPVSSTCLCVVGRHLPNSFADETKIGRRNSMV